MKKILVVGSLNMDSVIETPYMPQIGETILGKGVSQIPGGKGANQAYAIGKLGGYVSMIGAVGNDMYGKKLVKNLKKVNVHTSGIKVLDNCPTGQAYINVDHNGDNTIIVIPGANAMITKEMIDENRNLIEECDMVIMQLEIPIPIVEYVKSLALSMGKQIVLDPAPAANLPDSFFDGIDILKPNETELGILSGRTLDTLKDLKNGAEQMLAKGIKRVVVTLGSEGCLMAEEGKKTFFPANKVEVVDTTAAGDSFTAAFVIALSEGKSYEEAVKFGQKVSSIVVTKKGAQTSIPKREEVRE
ncbi:ribokinase [Lachnospiraceae bacterium]|uniref:ribokinase n=1 Tax=Extibacter sp. GGCC_0201 TaxID=2731209 RepID=UPI001AA12197|nr:ribokinase [Extibacter sp. GGCC_0201]MBO1719869.1 ribokinase [Extibacter sp. GGCC_0201]BDF35733.1 ribokinase [Lachnospiraceae bacterium]BDF39735.1 ribokinase [Lachnospiraceae bacterium]